MGLIDKVLKRAPGSADTAPPRKTRGEECLPESARRKLQELRDAHEMVGSFARSAYHRAQDLREQKSAVEAMRTELRTRYNLRDDHERVTAETAKIERLDREIAAAVAQRAERAEPFQIASAVLASCKDFVDGLTAPLAEEKVSVKIGPNESPIVAVEKRRAAIAKLQADIKTFSSAPYPSADAKRAMRTYVEHLAAIGEPDTDPCIQNLRAPILPHFVTDSTVHETNVGRHTVTKTIDGASLIAWLFKDQIIARLEQKIDADAIDDGAMSETQRREASAKARAEILRLEREEEAIIEAAAAQGISIARRADASPLAILGVAEPGSAE